MKIDIENILYRSIPKHKASTYKIGMDAQKKLVGEVMRRANALDLNLPTTTLDKVIHNFNRAVS